jgi:hypothetical protein
MSETNTGTRWRTFFAGRFLTGPEIANDLTVTIARVNETIVEDPDGGAAKRRMQIDFRDEGVKPWLPCVTTATCLDAMYGEMVEGWVGKAVTLYFDPTIKVGKERVGGIRVRGAPGLGASKRIEIKLPKRKPIWVELVDTAPRSQGNGRAQGQSQTAAPKTIEQILADAGATAGQLDAYLVAKGKPPFADQAPEARAQLVTWLGGPNAAKVRAEIAAVVLGGDDSPFAD